MGRRRTSRWLVPVRMVAFDLLGPLLTYSILRGQGVSAVGALIVAASFPTAGVMLGALQDRRLDALGLTVLVGTLAGAVGRR